MRAALITRLRASKNTAKIVLDQPIGVTGTGIYAGKTLVAGMDFTSATAASLMATSQSPKNPLWGSQAYRLSGQFPRSADQAGLLKFEYDTDIGHTGWNDMNGGIPMPYDNGAPQQVLSLADTTGSGGTRKALRLHAVHQSAAEQALLDTGNNNQVERTSMAHTFASLWWCAPAMIRTRGAIPTGPAGWHPTIWSLQIPGNAFCYVGSEHGFECNASTYTSAYEDPHNGGVAGTNPGTTNIGSTYRDGAPHDWVWDEAANNIITYYVDSATPVNTLTSSKSLAANPSYALWTSHIVTTFQGESYSPAAWVSAGTAGANLDVFGMQVWVPAGGKLYTPLVTLPDVLCTPGQSISVTIPDTTTLWGVASAADQIVGFCVELEEPGNTTSGWAGAGVTSSFPAWLTLTGRTLSGTVPVVGGDVNVSGAINVAVGYCPSGNACNPATFRIVVAPAYTGASTVGFINGQGNSFDLYGGWDAGRDFIAGAANRTAAKALTASGLPPGMTLGTNGFISGTPTTNGSYTITTTATNNDGQTATASLTALVQAAATAVVAPTGITSYALIGSWDPADAGTVTAASGIVTALAKSSLDSTSSPTLVNASSGPVLASRLDGVGHTRNVLRFTATSSQYLQAASGLGISAGCTLVIVGEHATVAASQTLLDVGASASPISLNRHVLISSATNGFSHRKCDAAATSAASVGTGFTTGIHLHVGRSPAAAATAAIYNLDGTGTAIVSGTTTGVPASVNYTTVGAARTSNTQSLFLDGWVYRILVYAGPLTNAEVETIAAWAATNYGTVNAA